MKQKLHEIKESFRGSKWAPAFNAIHTFLYTPNEVTHSGTHVKAVDDLKRTMNTVIQALIPVLLFGIFNCLLYTSPSPRDRQKSRMPSSA